MAGLSSSATSTLLAFKRGAGGRIRGVTLQIIWRKTLHAIWREGWASNRETVAGWILNSLAASAAILSPLETILRISACC